jgi:putative FmdB family regulatory protein
MPIYAYRCSACGHAQDVLQKLSDPVLTRCPACAAEAYAKQVTAAGFQLKGSGWYVTDFRNGSGAKPDAKPDGKADAKPEAAAEAKPADGAAKPAAPAAPAPAPAAAAPSAGPAPPAPPPAGSS